jgi:hypothetical protein
MNRTPKNHSYADYTGKPYIYYNGVSYVPGHMIQYQDEHPYRTIVRTNVDDKFIINRVPINGMFVNRNRLRRQC